MSSIESQDSKSVRDLKQKLNDEIRAGNITWHTIANGNLEGQLWQKIWSIVAKDGKFMIKFQRVFTSCQQGQEHYQHLKSTYSSLSSLHTFVRGVFGIIADSSPDAAAEFVAVLTGSHSTSGVESSHSYLDEGQGSWNSPREPANQVSISLITEFSNLTSDEFPSRQSSQTSSQDFYDPGRAINPRQTLINPAQRLRYSISSADSYALPELHGDDEFMQDEDVDNSGKGRRPAGIGRPFETWAPQ